MPSAFEKQVSRRDVYLQAFSSRILVFNARLVLLLSSQGSAKLEKAEILQMTVDHLKMLHATCGKGNRSSYFVAGKIVLFFFFFFSRAITG